MAKIDPKTLDLKEKLVSMMHSDENLYLEDENTTGFIKYYDDKANIAKVLSTYYNEIDDTIYLTLANPFDGLEGGVLKDKNNVFKNGTSGTQLKIKLKVDYFNKF